MRFPILMSGVLAACAGAPQHVSEYDVKSPLARDLAPSDADVPQLARDNATFAVRLYQAAAAEPGNLFMSPHSISTALAMTFAGARGQTASEMVEALELRLPPDRLHEAFNALDLLLASRPATLVSASSLWGQHGMTWQSAFLDSLALHYGAGLNEEDFAGAPEVARRSINDWIAGRTADAIPELFAPGTIEADSRLVLANAIRFQANWSTPFRSENTVDRPFFVGSIATSTPSLVDVGRRASFVSRPGYRAIELPYGEDPIAALSMVIIEPDVLAAFEANLGPALTDVLGEIASPDAVHLVDLTLPKFRYRASLDLAATLQKLGMMTAFTTQADLSGFTTDEALKIKSVVHEGIVGIDERGTDVAAATGVVSHPVNQPPPATFVVDQPFVFVIRDRPTGAILFIGRVVDPRAS